MCAFICFAYMLMRMYGIVGRVSSANRAHMQADAGDRSSRLHNIDESEMTKKLMQTLDFCTVFPQ